MPKRTSPRDAQRIEVADDLDDVVTDKREGWRATAAKARRRQRRYSKQLTNELTRMARNDQDDL
ncbi:hypothetical protein KUV51_05900 [Tateyamaria omphalii]|uniref:hypothetical protein n=1 Tax=Tateyamaria omphalii TaxID=299262 RepID=UPI001C9998DC|nr:hypothetical protein [Tateyamaria omphalii]MBY5932526.1 hypothetical protein [Tateyamaria omphalii]